MAPAGSDNQGCQGKVLQDLKWCLCQPFVFNTSSENSIPRLKSEIYYLAATCINMTSYDHKCMDAAETFPLLVSMLASLASLLGAISKLKLLYIVY